MRSLINAKGPTGVFCKGASANPRFFGLLQTKFALGPARVFMALDRLIDSCCRAVVHKVVLTDSQGSPGSFRQSVEN